MKWEWEITEGIEWRRTAADKGCAFITPQQPCPRSRLRDFSVNASSFPGDLCVRNIIYCEQKRNIPGFKVLFPDFGEFEFRDLPELDT